MCKTIGSRSGSCLSIALAGLLALLVWPHAFAQAGSRGSRAPLEGLVNINAASFEQLQLLSGVGPAKAQKIVEYREKQPFRTVEELGRVKGIGPKTVRKLRAFLTVHGPTTAHPADGAKSASPAAPPTPPPLLQRPAPTGAALEPGRAAPPTPASPSPRASSPAASQPAGAAEAPVRGSLGAALPR